MIALDTNVLVRFLVQDDPAQADAARSLIDRCSRKNPAFVCREVLIETVWVLESAYRFSPAVIADAITGLLEAEEFVIEAGADAFVAALAYRDGMADFADHMIAAAAMRAGCATLYTFDRKAARHRAATLLVK